MTTDTGPYYSKFAKQIGVEYEARGVARGKAESLLDVLAGRGFAISAQLTDEITHCTDLTQLTEWTKRAITASSLEEIFVPHPGVG